MITNVMENGSADVEKKKSVWLFGVRQNRQVMVASNRGGQNVFNQEKDGKKWSSVKN